MRRLLVLVYGLLTCVAGMVGAQSVSLQVLTDPGGQSGTVVSTSVGDTQVSTVQSPRDRRVDTPRGTGRIRGRVVDSETGAAVRRVLVRLSVLGAREGRTTFTDSAGQFDFAELTTGRYFVGLSKAGYVNWSYGQKRPNEQGAPIEIAEGQVFERADVALPRGGVITGRIIDEYGEPVPEVMVAALRYQFTPTGPRQMMTGRTYQSNDIGEFRIAGLPPGEYLISATPMRVNNPFDTVVDDRSGYGPVYYPGTPDPAAAQKVSVASGQVIGGIALSLIPSRTSQISGMVFDETGEVVRSGMLSVSPLTNGNVMLGGAGAPIRADGTFTLTGLTPGTYLLRSMPPMPAPAPGGSPLGMRTMSTATVTVNGEDLTGVRVEPQRPVQISGRLTIAPEAMASFRPQTVRVTAAPVDSAMMMGSGAPAGAPQPVREDGTFSTTVGQAGGFIVRVAGLPSGWIVRRVLWRGVDVTDKLDVPSAGIDDLDIELSSRAPIVSGRVLNGRGEVTNEYVALVFPQEEDLWTTARQTRQSLGRPDPQGRFTIRSVPAGNYYLVAVDHLDNGQSYDPAFLESIRHSATRVTLREGDNQTIDLTLAAPR